jgi:hypothetical protein
MRVKKRIDFKPALSCGYHLGRQPEIAPLLRSILAKINLNQRMSNP